MSRAIIIGYGNIDRADDGAAYAVINLLRGKWGLKSLPYLDTGLDALGAEVDSVFLSQLAPEILDVLTGYDRIIFVDAHVGAEMPDLHCIRVLPEYAHSPFTHHMTPAVLMAFLETLYQHKPEAHLVSVRGYDFDFNQCLSPRTQALLNPAVEKVLRLLAEN